MKPCWQELCEVEVGPLIEWLKTASISWFEQPSPDKPQRVYDLTAEEPARMIDHILPRFPASVRPDWPMLSRMKPGQFHPMHVDIQRADWLTRVHVPLLTNDRCWMWFEEEEVPVHFAVGHAYTFNALRRHSFANEGDTDRVHFIFDVLLKD